MCLPVDCEADLGGQQEGAGVGLGVQSVYGRWALGWLWYNDMRVVRRQAVRKWASFEPGGLVVDSSQSDGV